MKIEKRCSKCVIPQATRDIKFDENGVCELCNFTNDMDNRLVKNDNQNLNHYINKIKEDGRGRKYDCLVGVSGGRDSAYLLYLLTKKHGLKCMAAYYKTPFTPDIIDDNVKMLTKKLNVPLVQMNISTTKHRDFAKKMVNLWIKKKDKIFANLACAPCKEHNQEIYKIAKKNDISYIVFGGNKLENYHMAAGQSKRSKVKQAKEINLWQIFNQMMLVAMRGISTLFKHPKLILDFPILFKSSILQLNNRTIYLRMRYSNIKMMDYYYLTEYDEKAVIEFLSEIGWKIPENCNSTWRADCSFNEMKNYIFKKTTGMTPTDAFLSNSVRAGHLTRNEALKRAKAEGKISKERIDEVCNILEISNKSFQ